MKASFWLQRWAENNIGFHENEANPLLVKNFDGLSLDKGSRVFVPLCGKTLDIAWLLTNGCRVAGVELSASAIDELFIALGVEPELSKVGELTLYSAKGIDIFVGDIFDLSTSILGPINAIYDRAALMALPKNMRVQYAAHIVKLTRNAPQLLICYEYEQSLMEGPPFSISNEEVNQHYKACYDISLMDSTTLLGGIKGKCEAMENTWLLHSSPEKH